MVDGRSRIHASMGTIWSFSASRIEWWASDFWVTKFDGCRVSWNQSKVCLQGNRLVAQWTCGSWHKFKGTYRHGNLMTIEIQRTNELFLWLGSSLLLDQILVVHVLKRILGTETRKIWFSENAERCTWPTSWVGNFATVLKITHPDAIPSIK